jgi:enoyl-CoA hydratase
MSTVLYDKQDRTVLITINRPEAMNAIDPETGHLLTEAWVRFRDDPDAWVAVITGAGDRAFCAGADLKKMIPRLTGSAREQGAPANAPMVPISPAFLKGFDIWKPIVAAINGYCLAGGMEIAQGTDIRIASERATFGLTEVARGLFPGGGSSVRMPRQVPYAWAMEILLIGDPISAEDALRIGFVNRVVPHGEVLPTAMRFAERLCKNSPVSVQAIKESVHRCLSLTVEQGYHEEQRHWRRAFQSEDAQEGPRAFAEKRPPVWKGR